MLFAGHMGATFARGFGVCLWCFGLFDGLCLCLVFVATCMCLLQFVA